MNNYYINYLKQDGALIGQVYNFTRLEYGTRENEIGIMTLTLPAELFPGIPEADNILEIYRQVGASAPYLELDTAWFIRKWKYNKVGQSDVLTMDAQQALCIVDRSIIAYAADTAYTSKTNEADDMMKSLIDENMGAGATDAARDISAVMTIQVDLTLAPSITKAFSWRRMLQTLQEIAKTSFEEGTYLVFDVVRTGPGTFEFQTFIDQRGTDRGVGSASPLVVSTQNGLLSEPELVYDYSEERNYIYIGGRGEGIDRNIVEVSDAARIGLSLLGRRELFIDYRNSDLDATLDTEGNETLKEYRPKIILTGTISDSENLQYGIDYKYGDIIVGQYNDIILNSHVDAISVIVDSGDETIRANVRGVADA